MDKELIAPCGANCAVCGRYLALRYDVNRKGMRMSYCAGCRPRNRKCAFITKNCKLLLSKKIEFCYECGNFPCKRLKRLDGRYQKFFRTSFVENLEYIKNKGMAKFLKAQQEKWRCSKCGEVICCHNGLCFNCDFQTLKKKKNKIRWEGN